MASTSLATSPSGTEPGSCWGKGEVGEWKWTGLCNLQEEEGDRKKAQELRLPFFVP